VHGELQDVVDSRWLFRPTQQASNHVRREDFAEGCRCEKGKRVVTSVYCFCGKVGPRVTGKDGCDIVAVLTGMRNDAVRRQRLAGRECRSDSLDKLVVSHVAPATVRRTPGISCEAPSLAPASSASSPCCAASSLT
jgi:hypothetical protein